MAEVKVVKLREEEEPDSTLFEGWEWSEWYAIMAPGRLRNRLSNWHERAKDSTGIRIRQNTLDDLFSDACYKYTLYEMMIVRGALKVPVYLGQTERKVCKRIGDYCTNGSHIKRFINLALGYHYQLFVRAKLKLEYLVSSTECVSRPKDFETYVLRMYDYAWNTDKNGNTRAVITRNISGKISLRIHRELVDDSTVGDSWQWSDWKCIMEPGRADEQDETWETRTTVEQVQDMRITGQTLKLSSKGKDLYPRYIANSYGIFEFMIKKNDCKTVAYVGSSEAKTLKETIFTYCNGESEIESLLNDALFSGYSVFARIRMSDSDTTRHDLEAKRLHDQEAAEQDRHSLLDQYDYAWNVDKKSVRNILKTNYVEGAAVEKHGYAWYTKSNDTKRPVRKRYILNAKNLAPLSFSIFFWFKTDFFKF